MPSRAAASRFCEQARRARPVRGAGEEQPEQRDHQRAAAEDPEELVADRDVAELQRAAAR